MKKLLLGASILLGSVLSMNAQITILAQPFGTASIPAGWSQTPTAVAGDVWEFNNTYGSNMLNQALVPVQGYCAYVDDWDNNPNQTAANWDTLESPSMNCSTYTHVYVSLNFMFWQDDGNETGTLAVSTNGGASWSTAINFPNTGGGWANGSVYDITPYAAGFSNVMVAFTYYNGHYTPDNGYVAVGMCVQNVTIYSPADYDVQVVSQTRPALMQVGTPYPFSGVADNFGGAGITSMDMHYYVNSPSNTSTQSIASIAGFNGLTAYSWSMPSVPFTPPSPGIYTVKFWADNLNGNPNINTDTLTATFWAIDSVKPRQALYEEQTGQSCVFCMIAAPNMDSVFDNNATSSNIIRYHVPIPARDFMYDANETPINTRLTYYGVSGAPWGNLDGVYLYPGADYGGPTVRYSSTTVQADNSVGSPFKIDITAAQYIASKDSFFVSAKITAFAAFSAGLTAQVALTIDSITYKYDLSQDDPQQSFASPIGTGAAGFSYTNCPDRYFDYLLKFDHVCEEMFPNTGNGTTLGAFTAGQTQTISFGWKKNHAWGAYDAGRKDSDLYDSSSTGQFVVFVQTNNAIVADGIPAAYVFQSASAPVKGMTDLGVAQVTNGVNFQLYPNPTNSLTTLAFNLTKEENVNVEVYNMLGANVFSDNEGMISSGQHTISINGSTLPNGLYLVKFVTDGGVTTQKLLIQR